MEDDRPRDQPADGRDDAPVPGPAVPDRRHASTRTTGLFLSPSGHAKYYKATDNLFSEQYRGLLPEDLVDILTVNKLHYSHGTESGVLFHLIGALSEFGKLGLTAIANSPAQVDELYAHTLEVLDRETIYGR